MDRSLLHSINQGLACGPMDTLMATASNLLAWIPVLALIAIVLGVRGGARGRLAVAAMVVAFALADPFVAHVLKPLFARPRPCHELGEAIRLITGCGGAFGFPSNHAANSAALAAALGTLVPRTLWFGVPIAVLVSFSRVYLGVHYPTDVLAGMAVGAAIGAGCGGLGWLALHRFCTDSSRPFHGSDPPPS